jgi:hypothetical protein
MLRRLVLVTAAALMLPAAAFAKGPVEATIAGPGLDGTVTVGGNGEDGGVSALGRMVENAGFFPLAFSMEPDPTTAQPPQGDLGPRYTVVYSVPGPEGTSRVTAELYPYADPPVVHMAPGQPLFEGRTTHGGWILAADGLKPALEALGLPETAPPTGSPDTGGFLVDTWLVALLAGIALALVAASGVFLARRPRTA